MKKLVSIMLCAVLLCGVFCIGANAEEVSSTVPKVTVTTVDGVGNTLEKADGYVDASIVIEDTDGSVLEDAVSFKVRGNSTAKADKKPFTFKFGKKKDVLGMGKGKKWALLANAFDPTLMRNYIAFDLAHELDMTYASEQRYVELWVDGVFKGCYTLMEPVEEGKDRVNIDIESNDGMNDFMIEVEQNRVEDDVTYIKSNGYRFSASEPEEPNEAQLAYMQEKIDAFTDAFMSKDYSRMEEVADIESFAKFYLLNEFVKNVDANYSSVYYYYKDGKFYAGPPWDYDLASGNPDPTSSSPSYQNCADPERLFVAYTNMSYYLMLKNEFRAVVRDVYSQHYSYFCNIYAEGGLIDDLLGQYGGMYARNFDEAGWDVSKKETVQMRQPFDTYGENVAFLRDWYAKRNAWLGNELGVYGVNLADMAQPEGSPRTITFAVDVRRDSDVTDFSVECAASEPLYFQKTLEMGDADKVWTYTSRKRYFFTCDLPAWATSGDVNLRIVIPGKEQDLEPLAYAAEIPVADDAPELVMGDLNHDGKVTVDDATDVQKLCADLIEGDAQTTLVGDIDGDGVINVIEATKIQQKLAEIYHDGYTRNIGKTFRV